MCKMMFIENLLSDFYNLEYGKLETNVYIKPSNLQLYLDFSSNHPEPCKQGVVYGQALRIVERCSKIEWDKHKKSKELQRQHNVTIYILFTINCKGD